MANENINQNNKGPHKVADYKAAIGSVADFVDLFVSFRKSVLTKLSNYPEEDVVTLFAIFLKDARTERINGNNGIKKGTITPKQQKAVYAVMRKGKIPAMTSEEIQALSKEEATELLNKADASSATSNPYNSGFSSDQIRDIAMFVSQALFREYVDREQRLQRLREQADNSEIEEKRLNYIG